MAGRLDETCIARLRPLDPDLFAVRGATLKEGAPFELVSRETGLVINNLLLSVVLGIVFLGTLYPLFVEAVSGEKLSVGAPYFNSVAGPLALLLAVLVGIGPLLAWRRERRPIFRLLAIPALLGVTALVITIILAPGMSILPRLGLTVAAYLAAASILPLVGRNPLRAPPIRIERPDGQRPDPMLFDDRGQL